jgi:hypothetical protein
LCVLPEETVGLIALFRTRASTADNALGRIW